LPLVDDRLILALRVEMPLVQAHAADAEGFVGAVPRSGHEAVGGD
jgi:hypothetical protein